MNFNEKFTLDTEDSTLNGKISGIYAKKQEFEEKYDSLAGKTKEERRLIFIYRSAIEKVFKYHIGDNVIDTDTAIYLADEYSRAMDEIIQSC